MRWAAVLLLGFAGVSRANSYLPLVTGNLWVLNYQNQAAASMSLEVLSTEDVTPTVRRAKVLWTTPWGFSYTMVLRTSSAGIEHEGFIFGTEAVSFPNPLPLFLDGNAGQVWTSALGTITLVSKTASVVTPTATYANVRQYRILYSDGSQQTWFLADGVGYVQFGESPMQFPLASKTVSLEPVPVQTVQTPGPCPIVGIDPNPPANQTSTQILSAVAANGARFYEFSIPWSQLEPSAGKYDLTLVNAAVQQAKAYGMQAAMTLKTVDTNSRSIPSDLMARSWNDSVMLTRFRNMLSKLGPALGTTVKWIQLANEVDLYFINRPTEVTAFRQFLDAGQSQLKTAAPSISTGIVFNYDALRLSNQTFLQLKSFGNHYGFTFYNLDGTTTRSPDTIPVELATMIGLAAGKPIVLTEIGYPSAVGAGSSLDKQSRFYSLLFDELRKASGKIVAARVFQMTDLSTATAESIAAAYGYSSTSPFASYLGSLGLSYETGNYKPAFSLFQTNLPSFIQSGYCYSITTQ